MSSVGGTYTVVPATNILTLNGEFDGTPTPVPFTYEFDGDDRVSVTADADLVQQVIALGGQQLPVTLEGRVTLTFARDG
jgi:hypothetical protein